MMAVLEVSQLTKRFGGVVAVDDLSFSVLERSIFGIIGPNGAGKTTLFNVLTGFLKADSGNLHLRGEAVLGRRPYQLVSLGLARSFQIVKPFLGMTVRESLRIPMLGARTRRHGSKAARELDDVEWLMGELGLGGKMDIVVDDLNLGELRLLDIARSLLTKPDVLFLDEPFSGLGQQHVDTLSRILLSLREGGMTIVMVEHRLRELMRLVDTVMAINFGRKLAEGEPAEIVRDHRVVEAYLGTKREYLEPTPN